MSWREVLVVRFKPNVDLAAVAVSWCLVVGALATATFVITPERGVGYFLVYAVVGAAGFGVALPTWWMVWRRGRTIADLGVTARRLGPSLALQALFSAILYSVTLARVSLPDASSLLPLVALSACIGLFEAIFWRGWVQNRLEESFGFIPAVLVGSGAYALYHIGYGMGWGEIGFLYLIGLLYGVTFRLTRSVFILWPLFQPIGQLTTLLEDGLDLPAIASLGFVEVLVVMIVVLVLAWRFAARRERTATHFEGIDAAVETPGSSVN